MITLINGELKRKFSIKQVENILYIQNEMRSGNWKLEDDSPYEYKDNALIKRSSKKNCTKQATSKAVTNGGEARGKAEISHSDDT